VLTLASRRRALISSYFESDEQSAVPDDETLQDELLPELQAASVKNRIAMGERKGQRVRRLGALEYSDFAPELTGPLCAMTQGFSLYAAIYCAPYEREKLEKLCRYITHPAVSEERLNLQPSGDIVLKLKTKYFDGTSHLPFSGLEFVEKLAALVPPPRIHLTRFFGCLAPHSKIRSQIVPKTEIPPEAATATCDDPTPPDPAKKSAAWVGPSSGPSLCDRHASLPELSERELQARCCDPRADGDPQNSDSPRALGQTSRHRAAGTPGTALF
jgi:hypothetical protein